MARNETHRRHRLTASRHNLTPYDSTRYIIALGSNQRHRRLGAPRNIVVHAIDQLANRGMIVLLRSDIVNSRPLGPSLRQYANGVIMIESPLPPIPLLNQLKAIEAEFGIRRGQRWSQRVLDLDIILWSDGPFVSDKPALATPHPAMHLRDFVLGPASQIAADWRDPITGLTVKQLRFRQKRAKPLDRKPKPH